MKPKKMEYFSIYGLFGTKDVHIPFGDGTKILIGENGIGKTQVLNIFYYTLTRNFQKLIEFPFNSVELRIGGESISFTKKELINCFNRRTPFISNVIDIIGVSHYEVLKNEMLHYGTRKTRTLVNTNPIYSKLRDIGRIDLVIERIYEDEFNRKRLRKKTKNNLTPKISASSEILKGFLSEDVIMYFPTFRRVEEDLHNLGYDEEELHFGKEDTKLIHFGMDDVQKRFATIEKKIDLLLKEGFTKISSEILSKLIKGFGKTNEEILDRINEADIEIILARVGNQISEKEKKRIKKIVKNKNISEADNSLVYFLQALIDIYEKQKEYDNSIKEFKTVCNDYLIGKEVVYDESEIKIFVKSQENEDDKPLDLSKLSSGEKQIISIFSKIYLSDEGKRFIVLFDEPELSLSMTWQKQLLPDILKSNKCDFLLAVTHSPFIFENKLDKHAVGLNEYIKPSKKMAV